MSVSVISCLYGDRGYDRFLSEWEYSLKELNVRPNEIIVAADRLYPIRSAHVFVSDSLWKHPQAYFLQWAAHLTQTEWIWILDMDDLALPDALDGLEDVTADVWQMGYERSDGEVYCPPQINGDEYRAMPGNPFTAGSAIRRSTFMRAGGFPDAAFQDWGLWRRLARIGATFEASGRAHYRYRLHERTRTALELTVDKRDTYIEEMDLVS